MATKRTLTKLVNDLLLTTNSDSISVALPVDLSEAFEHEVL